MKILFIGDIFGEAGMQLAEHYIPMLKKSEHIQLTVANAENCSYLGRGISLKDYKRLLSCGVDICTMGNHTFDNEELIDRNKLFANVVRPANMIEDRLCGKGWQIVNVNQMKVLVINLLGTVFMKEALSPFDISQEIIDDHPEADAILVDFHAETTSEKIALGYFLSGKVSAVLGTHTHVPTADARLINGTAYITDVGMTGADDGVIGMRQQEIVERFKTNKYVKCPVADAKSKQFNACVIDINQEGNATKIKPINIKEPEVI